MRKNGIIIRHSCVTLNKSRMDELCIILLKYFDYLLFSATTVDDSSIEFNSYDELMSYENFREGRIKILNIYGQHKNNKNNRVVVIFSAEHSGSGIAFDYIFERHDEEILFCKDVKDFLAKTGNYHILAIICDLALMVALSLIFGRIVKTLYPSGKILVYVALLACAAVLYLKISNWAWNKLFPPVSFEWGESISYYKRLKKWRENMFWGVIVAFIVGIAVSVLPSFIL